MIGNSFADDLAELRDRLPPFEIENVRQIIKESFEKDIEEIFLNFGSGGKALGLIVFL